MALVLDGSAGVTFPVVAGGTSAVQASSGKVLQVVNATYSTQTSTVSTSYVSSGLTASITPSSSSSKILAICSFNTYNSASAISSYYTLFRGASNLLTADGQFRLENGSSYLLNYGGISYLDSPATTSSTTYSVYMKSQTAGATTYMAFGNAICSITLMEIAA